MKSLLLGSMGFAVSMVLGGCAANTESGIPAPVDEPAPSTEVGSKATATPTFDAKSDVALVGTYGEQTAFRVTIAGGDTSNEVFSAPVSHDGVLGAWRKEASLPSEQSVSLVHASAGVLAIGSSGKILRSIDGAEGISHWREMGAVEPSNGIGVASNGTSLLVLGGENVKGLHADATLATLNDGLPKDFTNAPALPNGLAYAGAVRLGAYTFVTGGTTSTGPTADVLVSRTKADGTLEGWKNIGALPMALSNHAVATYADDIYLIGGESDVLERNVLVARMNDAGELSAWSKVSQLPSALSGACVTTSGNHVMVLGGQDGTSRIRDVLMATIQADGSLSAWSPIGKLPTAQTHLGCSAR